MMETQGTDGWFDPDATTFGDRLAGARELAGMSQAELAKRLGIKKKTLNGWENDHAEPRANHLSMMAGLLNVSLLWLLSGEGDGPSDPAESGELSDDVTDLLAEVRDIGTQLTLASDRLVRLEKELRARLREDAVDSAA